MPSFDISSEVDEQEIRNAVDQASREIGNRFDFKDTNSSIELGTNEITLRSVSQDRLTAVRQVLEEKLVKRKISMKALDYGKVEDAAGGTARQVVKLAAGISSDKAQGTQQVRQGARPQGCAVPDPGRADPGHRQEARRPPDGHPGLQGGRLRHPAAVRQLPGLSRFRAVRADANATHRERRRATRSAVLGWVENSFENAWRALSGLTM